MCTHALHVCLRHPAEVEMSVDDPMELLVDGDGEPVDGPEEVLVDDPAQIQWLAGWPWGVCRPPQMAPSSSCWAGGCASCLDEWK